MNKNYTLAFLDFEFNPKTKIPTEIGICLSDGKEFVKKDLKNISFNLVMEEIYDFLPKTNICFIYFGQQEVNILNSLFKKNHRIPKHISSLYSVMINGINIIEKFPMLSSLSLYSLVRDLGIEYFSPAHYAINDAKNLKSLYHYLIGRTNKNLVFLISKNSQIDKNELNRQIQISQNNLRNSIPFSAKKLQKKNSNENVLPDNLDILINERTGERYYVTKLSKCFKPNLIYNIEIPFIKNYNGKIKEFLIYLIENYDVSKNSIKIDIDDICNSLSIKSNVLKDILVTLQNDNILYRVGKQCYQFIVEINFRDSSSKRKVMIHENGKCIKVLV